jgi:ubiquinone/menaquinone biosynthesis C-methylase UbiE
MNRKEHWDKVYAVKGLTEVSWYQAVPSVSLGFLDELEVPVFASIIDIGGGDSLLVDHLLEKGYTDITVLDISPAAIHRAKERLGEKAARVSWIVSDIMSFVPERSYDCWHDRAAFHFLTEKKEIEGYIAIAQKSIKPSGKIIIGTFSEAGPQKCSGLPVKQYSETTLTAIIGKWFKKIKCIHTAHRTPANTLQDFLFCSFKRINA